MTDKTDRPSTWLQAQKIYHEANIFGEQEDTSEINVSVLMGDRTQTTNLEILGMVY